MPAAALVLYTHIYREKRLGHASQRLMLLTAVPAGPCVLLLAAVALVRWLCGSVASCAHPAFSYLKKELLEPGARPNRGGGGGCARALAVYIYAL
jgi:hypothetical protein